MTGVLINRGNLETERDTYTGTRPCEDEGRDWGDASTSQGMPKITSTPAQASREAWGTFSLTALRRNQHC